MTTATQAAAKFSRLFAEPVTPDLGGPIRDYTLCRTDEGVMVEYRHNRLIVPLGHVTDAEAHAKAREVMARFEYQLQHEYTPTKRIEDREWRETPEAESDR